MHAFFRLIGANILLLLALRVFEVLVVAFKFVIPPGFFVSELLGALIEICMCTSILGCFYPVFWFFQRHNPKLTFGLFASILLLLSVLHVFVLGYFFYQLEPLDVFLFHYSFEEILFTVQTTEGNYWPLLGGLVLVASTAFASIKKGAFEALLLHRQKLFLSAISVSVLALFFHLDNINYYVVNKSFYFYKHAISHLLRKEDKGESYSLQDAKMYQALQPNRKFLSEEYPLLHALDTTNELGSKLLPFDTKPNIVLLIVEGLNADYLAEYEGLQLMPKLNQLAQQSLYWPNCFTLGERSFAAVPSITGSLPYGNIGFTMLDKLPQHQTLMSVLKANDYFTSFFYGQGSWFHQKDRFFKHHQTDLIFDKDSFDESCSKVFVQNEENFFWGYHDKDLFRQSLRVLNDMPEHPLFATYFTGTSHAPFYIDSAAYYQQKIQTLIQNASDGKQSFYIKNVNYLQSVMFVDDAIDEFMAAYKKRDDYKNTVFIITGDHPMTELPRKNALKKYNVPLLIFSDKIVRPETYHGVVSHLDIFETLLGFLRPYLKQNPSYSAALGKQLVFGDTSVNQSFAMMNGVRQIIDFYQDGYFLSGEQLYAVDKELNIEPSYNFWEKERLEKEFEIFKKTNSYVSFQNKILPDSVYYSDLGQKLVLESIQTDTVLFSDEYFEVIPERIVLASKLHYSFKFDYLTESTNASIVYQLMNMRDSVLVWQNMGIDANLTSAQNQVLLSDFGMNESDSVKFKSFIWNRDKMPFTISKKVLRLRYSE